MDSLARKPNFDDLKKYPTAKTAKIFWTRNRRKVTKSRQPLCSGPNTVADCESNAAAGQSPIRAFGPKASQMSRERAQRTNANPPNHIHSVRRCLFRTAFSQPVPEALSVPANPRRRADLEMRLWIWVLAVIGAVDGWSFGKKKDAKPNEPNGVLKMRLQARRSFYERVYEMPVGVGIPRKPFYVQLDTTVNDIMLPGFQVKVYYGARQRKPDMYGYVKPNYGDGEKMHIVDYSPVDTFSKRRKVKEDAAMKYRRGEAHGPVYEDEFSFGHGKSAISTKSFMQFIVAKEMSFSDHGVFGLAPKAPFWKKLQDEGLIKEQIACIALQWPKLFSRRIMLAGRMTLGQVDKSICGAPVATLPVPPDSALWKTTIHGITFNGKGVQHHADGFLALVDTSAHYLYLPKAVFQTIAVAMGAKYNREYDMYTLPCKGPKWAHPLEVHLPGGVKALFSREEMLVQNSPSSYRCELTIVPHDKAIYLLGAPFLAKFCVILDVPNHKVVLAKKKIMLKDRLLNPILGKDRLLNPLLFG